MTATLRIALLAALMATAGLAHADFTGNLGTITPSGTVAFSNSSVTVGTIAAPSYNFLDSWTFVLGADASIAAIAATINFTAVPGGPAVFGIENLQINLVTNPAGGAPLVSWLTVTMPAPGLNQLVALVSPSPLGAGNYMVQVRGTLTAPGAYSGSIIASPSTVPLPAALPLLLLGLSGIGAAGFARRARKTSMLA